MRTVSGSSLQVKVAKIYNELTREKVTLYTRKAWIVGVARGIVEFIVIGVYALLLFHAGILLASYQYNFQLVRYYCDVCVLMY